MQKSGFTLPGEAGYEELTLSLAQRWGADVIRDSDGTELSEEILDAGYGIYSTLCIIRDHNPFLKEHPGFQQQCFLMSQPCGAAEGPLRIPLLEGYFTQQFAVNDSPDAMALWQVFNRTTGEALAPSQWAYADGVVTLHAVQPWHQYTVNFLAWRIWEEISMYNHVTNHWEQEHLMQLDPVYPEVQAYLLDYMDSWCKAHPRTTVVRFTSLFYNFVWVWGQDHRNRNLFTDWASYDFTVSPLMLKRFEEKTGYALTSEDFICGGRRNPCHLAPPPHMCDYIAFIHDFVIGFGRQLVDIVHRHGKQAYLFYDDSWVGTEPGSPRFAEFGFDGIIKCVFSGFEARLCSAVEGAKTHELRLHPYLFPVGLGGAPTFSPGGRPGRDAMEYWVQVRRALLRQPVDRLGLGGYLHLAQEYPDFIEAMDRITDEFAQIRALHAQGQPQAHPCRIGVLSAWGSLRRWTCGGHYHEHPDLDLLNLLESLAGLPFEVSFYSFDEVCGGVPQGVDILLNAGFAGSAWSGGDVWEKPALVQALSQWVAEGGCYVGVGQPSALPGRLPGFQMAPVLGVDEDAPALLCHGRWQPRPVPEPWPAFEMAPATKARLTSADTETLQQTGDGSPLVTRHPFGRGQGVYLAAYRHSAANAAALHQTLLRLAGQPAGAADAPQADAVEHHIFPGAGQLVFLNNSASEAQGVAGVNGKTYAATLPPYGMVQLPL